MNEDQKRILTWIIEERMKAKATLFMYSHLARENYYYEKEINYLLDRLKHLEELGERVRRMK
jgi:hypothetical protein